MRRSVGVVVLVLALAGCGGAVRVDPPRPAEPAAAACRALVADLPPEVLGAGSRPVEPDGALAAAWGDPPILLRCGVPKPADLTRSSPCIEINGVGWFAEKASRGYVFTTVGRAAYAEVSVPSEYAPPSNALVDLAAAVRRSVPQRVPCQ